MVGHWVIGVPFSSMKLSNLSRKTRRSGWSSISYKRARLSELREDVCAREEKQRKQSTRCASNKKNNRKSSFKTSTQHHPKEVCANVLFYFSILINKVIVIQKSSYFSIMQTKKAYFGWFTYTMTYSFFWSTYRPNFPNGTFLYYTQFLIRDCLACMQLGIIRLFE